METVIVDLTQLLTNAPRNCWLALNEQETEVVGRGETVKEAVDEATSAGVSEPVIIWSPKKWTQRVYL